ncbi:hypothetical protein TWF281_001330 [Arthrobotrys megalospora]
MPSLLSSAAKFAEAIKNWHFFPGRKPVALYPNHPAPGNPNFAPSIPPKPIERLNINITTAGSIIVAIEEYQEIMWRVRPTAWPSMPHDPREISDIKFHMNGLLQTLQCIIPDYLHEVPGPLRETMDCLGQSLVRLESINPDVRGKWQSFNQASDFSKGNAYIDILNLTNMKLRQLKDMAIGNTFEPPIEDREAESFAAMIIESSAITRAPAVNSGPQKVALWGLGMVLRLGKRKETTWEPEPQRPQKAVALQPPVLTIQPTAAQVLPSTTPLQPAPTPLSVHENPWLPTPPTQAANINIPGVTTTNGLSTGLPADIPQITAPIRIVPHPVSEHCNVRPIIIATPSSSPTHVAIREATEKLRIQRQRDKELRAKAKLRKKREAKEAKRKAALATRMAINIARQAALSWVRNTDNVSPGTLIVETEHIEHANPSGEENIPLGPAPPPTPANGASQVKDIFTANLEFSKKPISKVTGNPTSLFRLIS